MESQIYNEWLSARNKEDFKFYNNAEFREAYTRHEMGRKARLFRHHALPHVRKVLQTMSFEQQSREIKVLSLGCGPGSDLLGLLRAVSDALRKQDVDADCVLDYLTCSCTGVDAFPWNRQAFGQQFNELIHASGILRGSYYQFVHQSMEDFVLTRNIGPFDFICLSFADAVRNLTLIGVKLPQLLTSNGRVLVLDIDIPPVRELERYGFERTFTGTGICMLSRGQGNFNLHYSPMINSAIEMFMEAERVRRLQEATQRERFGNRDHQQQQREQRLLEQRRLQEQQQQQRLLEQKRLQEQQQQQQRLLEQKRLQEQQQQQQRLLEQKRLQEQQQQQQRMLEQKRLQEQQQQQQRLLEQKRLQDQQQQQQQRLLEQKRLHEQQQQQMQSRLLVQQEQQRKQRQLEQKRLEYVPKRKQHRYMNDYDDGYDSTEEVLERHRQKLEQQRREQNDLQKQARAARRPASNEQSNDTQPMQQEESHSGRQQQCEDSRGKIYIDDNEPLLGDGGSESEGLNPGVQQPGRCRQSDLLCPGCCNIL